MPRRTDRPPHTVAVLAYDGLCTFEFAIAVEIFGLPRPELGPDWYRFAVHPIQSGPLRATGGIRICAPQRNALARADTIVIPGWCDPETDPPPALLSALRRAHARGARLLSICSGVFVLAATGLLDGRRATTHWLHAERLRARYPRIEVDPGVIYVDEGQLLTSAGSSAGIDLCLHLVRRDYGPAVANQIARRLVVPAHREGGQAQYVERPVPRRERAGVGPLLDRIRAGLCDAPARLGDHTGARALDAGAGGDRRRAVELGQTFVEMGEDGVAAALDLVHGGGVADALAVDAETGAVAGLDDRAVAVADIE